jgi:hypothetical protein
MARVLAAGQATLTSLRQGYGGPPKHLRRRKGRLYGLLLLVLATCAAAQPAPGKVDIVSVTGCLRQQGDAWMLVAATEPVQSVANAPQKNEIPSTPPEGKLKFRLIGVGEFKLPALKDRTLLVRGLLIKDTPVSRINVTSVVEAAAACTPGAPG